MTEPSPPKDHSGYWKTWWRDSARKLRWKSFGSVKKLSRKKAYDAYTRWLAEEFYANLAVSDPSTTMTVRSLVARYQAHADAYYLDRDGKPTGEARNIAYATKHLAAEYPDHAAHTIGLKEMRAVRDKMIAADLCRNVINQRINKTRRMFRWAAGQDLIPDGEWMKLAHLEPLPPGRSKAKESEPVLPVPQAHIDKVLAELPGTHAAMVQVQLLTAMRPGELCAMRGVDIQQSGDIWWYTPVSHKTAWRGKAREIAVGPQARAILADWLCPGYLWKPTRRAAVQQHITSNAYLWAIYRACDRAKVDRWSPNQLRHNALTAIRREAGLEAAQAVGGHAKADTTEIYAERNKELAAEIARRVG